MVTGAGFKSLKDPVVDGVVVMLVGDMVIGNRVEVDSWRYCNWQERQENR